MKKPSPIITQTEILCLAIATTLRKLHQYDEIIEECTQAENKEFYQLAKSLDEEIWKPKLDALKLMYKFETGKEFAE